MAASTLSHRSFVGSSSLLLLTSVTALTLQSGSLSAKYGASRNILRGSPELFRFNATHAPLPEYPRSLLKENKRGLVVIEVVVSPLGRVTDSLVLESFDERASTAAAAILDTWRFHSEKEMVAFGLVKQCRNCLRINRLAFDFRIESGSGRVVDLNQQEIMRLGLRDPFQKRRH